MELEVKADIKLARPSSRVKNGKEPRKIDLFCINIFYLPSFFPVADFW